MSAKRIPLLAASLFVLASLPLLAHHSSAPFDASREIPMQGVVKRFEWTNPHAWLYMDVIDDKGQTTEWSIELGSPNSLKRQGWRSDSWKPGDKIKIITNVARDGSNNARMLKGYDAGGKQLGQANSR